MKRKNEEGRVGRKRKRKEKKRKEKKKRKKKMMKPLHQIFYIFMDWTISHVNFLVHFMKRDSFL